MRRDGDERRAAPEPRLFDFEREHSRRQRVEAVLTPGPVTVRRAAEPSSRAARTLAPATMAPCGSVTRPRKEEICANAGVASHPATNSAIGIAFRKDAEAVPRRLDARRIWPFSVCVLRTCVLRKGGGQAAEQACQWKRRRRSQVPAHAFCSPQKVSRHEPWVGLLARREQATGWCRCVSLHLPRPAGRVVVRSDAPSLTVAGPRRTCTGLPCYAPRGHPRPDRYITIHSPAAASVAARRPVTVTSSIAR